MVGSAEVVIGQLDRLPAVMSMPRVVFGVPPMTAECRVPTNQLIMFDDRLVHVERISAALTISQQAVYGAPARELVTAALADLTIARHPPG